MCDSEPDTDSLTKPYKRRRYFQALDLTTDTIYCTGCPQALGEGDDNENMIYTLDGCGCVGRCSAALYISELIIIIYRCSVVIAFLVYTRAQIQMKRLKSHLKLLESSVRGKITLIQRYKRRIGPGDSNARYVPNR